MVKSQVKSQISNQEEVQVKMEMVKYYFTKEGGMVIIYRIDPENELESFYIASFDDTSTDVPWGLGYTPEDALEDAVKRWDEESETEEEKRENPFREVKQLQGE